MLMIELMTNADEEVEEGKVSEKDADTYYYYTIKNCYYHLDKNIKQK